MDIKTTKSLMAVAQGKENADTIITNGRVFNVFTGELIDGLAVTIKHGRIAYVGKDGKNGLGSNTRIIDAAGKTLIPGFIDGHTHVAWLFKPEEFLKYAMTGGTTTIITEIFEPYPVASIAGVLELLDALKNQPIKFFATAPAMVSISQRTKGIKAEDLKLLLSRNDVRGLGESYWQGILQDPDTYLPAFSETLAHGKTLEGHSAGANEKKLNAYVASGISSCHEPIKSEEVLDRLRLGLYVMVREGSVRRELEAISQIKDAGVDLRRLTLVSDGVSPSALMENGYMEFIVQKAINLGFKPEDAIRMATLNVAEHFSLDGQIGAIAPGRFADILIIEDIRTVFPEIVISNGTIIARNGKRLVEPRPHVFSDTSKNSVKLPKSFTKEDFIITADSRSSQQTVRIIELVTDLVTRELHAELPVSNGEIKKNISSDIIKVAAIDRAITPGDMFTGFIKGFGLTSGAIAFTATWDSADIIVIGVDDGDMALAVNRLHEMQGGAVICDKGTIREELALPIFGLISDLPVEKIVDRTRAINDAVHKMGVPHPDPMLTLSTLTTAAIPFFRICEEGYVRLKDGSTMGLIP